ncbi:ROK family protein [Virgibacillus siamensis]|uniref:ROK family protein n=1 Tax=Virgibacillus siamensis TaxID=480071 RepID=UPI0009857C0E|nr:ROK family protein [Virgibacillus siamensis]
MKYSIGVDIGGTKVAVAIVDQIGSIVKHRIIPTDLSIPPEQMIKRIIQVVNEVLRDDRFSHDVITGIGVGVPGPLDSRNGMVTCPPNLATWRDVPIKQIMEADLPYTVQLENDANAATLAEKWLGAGRNHEHVIYMTVSTGIGAGIFTDGRLLRGRNGNAGDIGHTVIDPSFGECSCGQKGCLEAIASGTAIARHGSTIVGEPVTTERVFRLYKEKDPRIVEYIDSVFRVLGTACVNLVNTFDAEIIIIGGGVSKVGKPLFETAQEYVSAYALNPMGRQAKVIPAELEQNSGVIGAAALCL